MKQKKEKKKEEKNMSDSSERCCGVEKYITHSGAFTEFQ